jgi:hypothetical protein
MEEIQLLQVVHAAVVGAVQVLLVQMVDLLMVVMEEMEPHHLFLGHQ